jgi:hypothetical protein
MSVWSPEQSIDWYDKQGWLVGCNFLPSSCINQIEMFQEETFDLVEITTELSWAKNLGFNSIRVYLHDLLWDEKYQFLNRFNSFLECCNSLDIKPIIVLFDDCHYPSPKLGPQPLPIKGVHNSGWKQSPGHEIVKEIESSNNSRHLNRLKTFTQELLYRYKADKRILMWDLYNEPGQFGIGEISYTFLEYVWSWAHEVRPSQPLTSCLDGSIGDKIINLNTSKSDIITFHTYEADKLLPTIKRLKTLGRPIMCTEYMAREYGTTFKYCLPIFEKHNVACYNWGLVAGRSQTNFNWETILSLHEKKEKDGLLAEGDNLLEPELWFHDVFRKDGSPFDPEEVSFIKNFLKRS